MKIITIKGEARTSLGSKHMRKLRAAGKLPAIMYGHGEAPEAVALLDHDVEVALAHGARMLQVDIKGSVKPYLIKAVQYDHLSTTPIHMDLARVDLNERVTVRVGIELRGTPKGIAEGGMIDQAISSIEVECLVTEIPDTLHPLVTHLGMNDSLLVKDLPLPSGVTALIDGTRAVCTIRKMAEEVVAPVAGAVEGAEAVAEPERIGRIKKEEPGEGEEEKKK